MINLSQIISNAKPFTLQGKVADYIPALSSANPEDIGVCIIDLDGEIHKEGEYDKKFTMQSISKVIALMLAIMDNGADYVFERVGENEIDEPFNTFSNLDLPNITKPANPMINIGAILTTSLIKGDKEDRINRILDLTRFLANNPTLDINTEVYLSEKETGDRNRAMAYLMKSKGILNGDVDHILDTYFMQCSIELSAVDLAKIGEFIAKGCKGLELYNRITHKELTDILVRIMTISGMYNFSQEYMSLTGIPSKSGVGGGIMGVVPNKLGIGIYAPALDSNGNSIAGIEIMKEIGQFTMHN